MGFLKYLLSAMIWMGFQLSAETPVRIHSLELGLSGWHSKILEFDNNEEEIGEKNRFLHLPKVTVYGSVFFLNTIVELPLQFVKKNSVSELAGGDLNLLLGHGMLGFYAYGGMGYPLYNENRASKQPFVGPGNSSVNFLLGFSSPEGALPYRFRLAFGTFWKSYLAEFLGAKGILVGGDFDSYTFLKVSMPFEDLLQVYLESLFLFQQYTWTNLYLEEEKVAQTLGAGFEFQWAKIGFNIGGGWQLWSKQVLTNLFSQTQLNKEESAFYYSFKTGIYF